MTDIHSQDDGANPPTDAPPDSPAAPAASRLDALRPHPLWTGLGVFAFAAALVAGIVWYLHARNYEGSDDAFIDGRPIYIDLQVSGVIEEVPVTDNQTVKPGDLLVRIDKRDYEAAVALAQAQIESAEAGVANAAAQLYEQAATIQEVGRTGVEAQAALDFSKQENARYQDLVAKGAGTAQRAEQASSDLLSKQAALSAAQFAQTAADRQNQVLAALSKSAAAQLDLAKAQKATADANLSRTELRATTEGYITRLTAVPGQLATPGQGVMIVVPLDVWVTANFKETELAGIRPGEPVDIHVDAYGRDFAGHVNSIQAGSGTVFSLLPAENATGNYVKVVQRIPVKITFDHRPDALMGLGLSVEPNVTIR